MSWQGHCDDDDDDVIEDKDMNKAIARTIARPYGLKAVPGGDPMEADIGCYKHVCKDECDRRVYICNDCNLLDYMPTHLKEQSMNADMLSREKRSSMPRSTRPSRKTTRCHTGSRLVGIPVVRACRCRLHRSPLGHRHRQKSRR
jgi:hypothetical protein